MKFHRAVLRNCAVVCRGLCAAALSVSLTGLAFGQQQQQEQPPPTQEQQQTQQQSQQQGQSTDRPPQSQQTPPQNPNRPPISQDRIPQSPASMGSNTRSRRIVLPQPMTLPTTLRATIPMTNTH